MIKQVMETNEWKGLLSDYAGHICDNCNGQGCMTCKGSGEVMWGEEDTIDYLIYIMAITKCEKCEGSGCFNCGWIGYLEVVK